MIGRQVLTVFAVSVLVATASGQPMKDPIASVDHRIKHKSAVPGFEGQESELFMRERVPVKPNGEAVLCLHGLNIPGTPVFDLPHRNYSWLRYLAENGYRAYCVDMTGYGGSTRPAPMNDPRNLTGLDRIIVKVPGNDRPYPYELTSADSDLHDIDEAVEFIRREAKVSKIHLIGTSLGGGRSLVYAAKHPDKIARIVIQGWGIGIEIDNKPEKFPTRGSPANVTTEKGFKAKWEIMARRKGQVEPGMMDVVWKAMQDTDPEGAKWGSGVMRAPNITLYGWNKSVWDGIQSPVLLVHGQYDPLDPPGKALYESLRTPDKVNLTFEGVSHIPMWETGKENLFAASVEWLGQAMVDGHRTGEATVTLAGKYAWK